MVFGALVGAVGCVTVVSAQTQGAIGPDLFNLVGFASGAGALIAWGTQTEKVKGHGRRLDALEDDRVTRSEFETMGTTIRDIQSDVRQVREMLERRQIPR